MIAAIIDQLYTVTPQVGQRYGLCEKKGELIFQYVGGGNGEQVNVDHNGTWSYFRITGAITKVRDSSSLKACDGYRYTIPLRFVLATRRDDEACSDHAAQIVTTAASFVSARRNIELTLHAQNVRVDKAAIETDTTRAFRNEIGTQDPPLEIVFQYIDLTVEVLLDTDCLDLCVGVNTAPPVTVGCAYLSVCVEDLATGDVVTWNGSRWENAPPSGGPGGGVTSVNGDAGPAVVLDAGDVGADPAGTAAASMAAHLLAADPHPQYLTPAEGNAAYDPINSASGVQSNLAAHIADPTDAHDASAISFAPAGGIAATDAQAAIVEVAADAAADATAKANAAQAAAEATAASALSAHINDATDAHDASAISFTPAGSIAATDTQAAIEEVATDAASALSTHEADTTNVHGIADTSTLYRAGGTDVAVADGGTGASDAAGARTNLGLQSATIAGDVATTSATYVDITGLGIPVGIGTFVFDGRIGITTSSGANGVGISVNGPTTSSLGVRAMLPISATADNAPRNTTSYDAGGPSATADTSERMALLTGKVVTTASGTLIPRIRSANAGTSVSAKAGSVFTVTQIA